MTIGKLLLNLDKFFIVKFYEKELNFGTSTVEI